MAAVPPKLGIVGCGAIGSEVAKAVDTGSLEYELAALADIVPAKAEKLLASLSTASPRILDLDRLIDVSDVILECAAADAVPGIVLSALSAGKTAVVMSSGGLSLIPEGELLNLLGSGRIIVPSGAVGGIDSILAMRESGLSEVNLTTTKPPVALGRDDREKTVVFEGTALEAVKKYPKNINIAMTLYLAAGRDVPVRVRIVSDPDATGNTHEVEVVSKSGRAVMTFENLPHPTRAGTSFVAPLSAVATLKKLGSSLIIGT